MDILEEPHTNVKTEIVFSFNFEKGFCEPIPFNKPRQGIFFPNMKKADPGMKAVVFRTKDQARNDTNICLFNDQKNNIFRKQHGRDWLIFKYTLMKCAKDDKYYLGKPLEWTDTDYKDLSKTAYKVKWQWFKGMKRDKSGMWLENYELMDCLFNEMYPVEVWDISLRKDDVIMDLL